MPPFNGGAKPAATAQAESLLRFESILLKFAYTPSMAEVFDRPRIFEFQFLNSTFRCTLSPAQEVSS
jgi:hypothetical protein